MVLDRRRGGASVEWNAREKMCRVGGIDIVGRDLVDTRDIVSGSIESGRGVQGSSMSWGRR